MKTSSLQFKEIIHSQVQTYSTLEQKYGVTERDLINLRSQYNLLEEQLRLLKDKIYGRKSEQYVPDASTPQISLFNEPECHLKFYPMEGKRATIYLVVNTCQLVDDMLSALDNFVVDLKNISKKKRECEKRLNEFGNPSDFNSIQRSDSRNAVGRQIFLLGKIDRKQK